MNATKTPKRSSLPPALRRVLAEFKDAAVAANAEAATPFSGVRESCPPFANPQDVCEAWKALVERSAWYSPNKEHLVVFLLNVRGGLMAYHLVSIGGLTECMAHPREILRPVIVGGAFSFCLAHNHPSGDPAPSGADLQHTRKMRDAAATMSISFWDHVIIGEARGRKPGYHSFRENGML